MSDYGSFWRRSGLAARLRGIRPCGKDRPALLGPFGRFSLSGARCRSSVVEHSIGNGEVDSSILSGSTSPLLLIKLVLAKRIGRSVKCCGTSAQNRRGTRRSNDVCARRHHKGVEPKRRAGMIPRARTRIGSDVGQVLAHVHDAEIEIAKITSRHQRRCINGSTTGKTRKAPAFAWGIR
jgi:hypothetical protein